uniref:Uncharacterized protein n=1 Tax=Ditylenchus dipsaci TaxID=166011 RepID=A0A915CP02_9BILA
MPPANCDLNAASLSSLSSKSATVSSSSINDSLNQKSTSTECFVNSPQIISKDSRHRLFPELTNLEPSLLWIAMCLNHKAVMICRPHRAYTCNTINQVPPHPRTCLPLTLISWPSLLTTIPQCEIMVGNDSRRWQWSGQQLRSLNSMGSLDRQNECLVCPCYNPMASENAHSNLAQYNNSGGQPGEVKTRITSP